MANPQKENGYTPIANEVMDALARFRIPGESRQVLDVILRKTYGWNKKEDRISLSQFSEATGLKRPNVTRAIAHLSLLNMIRVVSEPDGKRVNSYSFNKDWTSWRVVSKAITGNHAQVIHSSGRGVVSKMLKGGIKSDTTHPAEISERVVSKAIHTKALKQSYNSKGEKIVDNCKTGPQAVGEILALRGDGMP